MRSSEVAAAWVLKPDGAIGEASSGAPAVVGEVLASHPLRCSAVVAFSVSPVWFC